MRIALIFTPTRLVRNWSTLLAQQEHMGIMPPLSLTYVAAIAEQAGHHVMIIDICAEALSFKKTVTRLREFAPDLIGFTITTYAFFQTLAWIRALKDAVSVPVLVGGWHLSLYPEETMSHREIDYAVIGEAEITLPMLLSALTQKTPLDNIPGIAFRSKTQCITTSPAQITKNLDTIPFPALHLLKNSRYFNILSSTRNFSVMLSARGCPYQCIFCELNAQKFRMRSTKNFVDEIERNYRYFNIREFDIYDSTFTVSKERTYEICEQIRNRRLPVRWTVRSRVDNIDKNLLRAMSLAGCTTIMYGIESADPRILKILRKDINPQHIKNAIRWTKELGMKSLGFFMLGVPGEDRGSALRTIRFSTQLDLDYVQFTRLLPFPHTEVYRMLMATGFGDYWREFTKDASVERDIPLVGTELEPQEVMKLVRKAYRDFYFRPRFMLRSLCRIKSFYEFKNSLKAAIGFWINR